MKTSQLISMVCLTVFGLLALSNYAEQAPTAVAAEAMNKKVAPMHVQSNKCKYVNCSTCDRSLDYCSNCCGY